MKFFVVFLSVAALAYSTPVPQEESVLKLVAGNFVDCMNSDLNLCVKEHALRATERLGTVRKLHIIDGVTLLNNGAKEGKSLEPLSTEPLVRNKQVTERLWEKATDLFQNGELEFSYGGEEEESRALEEEEGRGKKKQIQKKLKMLMPLAMLIKAKAIALAVLFLGVIAVSLWKLAVIAKIAFIAKLLGIVKMLIAKKNGGDDHGWAAPVHDDHGHGGHGGWESQGWGRSKNEAADLAYAAYKQH